MSMRLYLLMVTVCVVQSVDLTETSHHSANQKRVSDYANYFWEMQGVVQLSVPFSECLYSFAYKDQA